MDELRATPFSAGIARAAMWRFLWWIGCPWLLLTVVALRADWIDQAARPLGMVGIAMVAAPLVMLLHDLQTLYVITDRRALILRTAWSRRAVSQTSFEAMDAVFEILDIGRGAGHLNFASGRSTRSPDTDYTGRYGFRCVRNPAHVRDILDGACSGKTRRPHPGRSAASTGRGARNG